MLIDYLIWLIPYGLLCYAIAMWGGNKKIGFGVALLASLFLTPIVGVILVARSEKKAPVDDTWKREQISEEYPESLRIEYSKLLSDFHEGEISEPEFEKRKGKLLNQNGQN
jgi:hypothetical protein